MKANELRKGNLIYGKISEDEDGNDINELILCEFLGYDPFEGNFWVDAVEEKKAREYYDSFEPIPLTEEWLLKFGFQLLTEKRVGTKYSEYGNGEIHYEKRFTLAKHADKDYWYCLRGSVKIQFVHQLQNLYFALTGSELPTDHRKLPTE